MWGSVAVPSINILCTPHDPPRLEELTPRPDTPPDRTTLRFIPDLDVLVPSPKLKSSKSGIDLRAVRSGGVSGLGVSSSICFFPPLCRRHTWQLASLGAG